MSIAMPPGHNLEHPPRWPMVLAIVLHLALIGWVIYAGKFLPPLPVELPDAVELWEGGKPPQFTAPPPVPTPKSTPRVRDRIPDMDLSQADDAEIKLNQTRQRAERERINTTQPEQERRTTPPPQSKPEPNRQQETKPQAKPAKPTRQDTFDPTADLDLPGAGTGGQGRRGSGNASRTQQGSSTGAENGVQGGRGVNLDAYKREVVARIRSYASAPPGTEGSPRVTVSVRLDPSMRVINVSITKSSGDNAYDQAVVQGVRNVGQFPARPDGASMDLFRNITLNISLPNR